MNSKKQLTIVISVPILILWALVLYKAVVMGMTHDESASFYYLNHRNVLPFLFDSGQWPNANNHWLNTVFFQLVSRIFGPQEWAIRLLNIISFGILGYYLLQLTKYFQVTSLRWACILMIVANPYLLDFYSTARGYGVGLAMFVASLYHCSVYLHNQSNKQLIYASIWLLLSTLALFSNLIFLPVIFGATFLLLTYKLKWTEGIKPYLKPGLIMLFGTVVTLALSIIPISALSKNEEFKWGAESLLDCFANLVSNSGYGRPYVPKELFVVGFFTALLIACGLLLYKTRMRKAQTHTVASLAGLSLLLLVGLMVCAKALSDTYYPIDRKTILFLPFISILLFGTLDIYKSKVMSYLGWGSCLIMVYHFAINFNPTSVREWWYDQYTEQFVNRMAIDAKGQAATVGCHWMFHPTTAFYTTTRYPNIKIMDYNKNIDVSTRYDYFICFKSDLEQLQSNYEFLTDLGSDRVLMKHK